LRGTCGKISPVSGIQDFIDSSRDAALGCLYYFQNVLSANTQMPGLAKVLLGRASSPVNILELGAGCGVAGIALAHCFPNCVVQLTDRAESQGILCRNVNFATPAKNSSLQARTLDWEAKAGEASMERDLALVIVSDCTYNADSCPDLVSTLSRVSAVSSGVRILVALKRRHDSEDVFFSLMGEAHMQLLEQTTVELAHEPSVHDSEPPKVELYVYGLQQVE
jgi:Lysine methyltransferase